MKKITTYLMSILFVALSVLSSPALAADHEKDEDRLKNSGIVLKEILDVPDDIPQDLLDKADCVVVFPSVLKAAFIVGGSYGRGAMSCRQGENFKGPWGRSHDDGPRGWKLRLSDRWTSHGFCAARDE